MRLFERLFGKKAWEQIQPVVEGPYERLLHHSIEKAKAASKELESEIGVGREDSWSFDQDEGELVLKFAERSLRVKAQIVGSYSYTSGTWLWAWSNPDVAETLTQASRAVRTYGVSKGIDDLSQAQFACEEDDAWAMAAVALSVAGGIGLYSGDTGAGRVFFLLERIVKSP